MRSRVPFFTLLFTIGFFAVPHFARAAIPFFGPIIPAGSNVCPAGWGMLITVVNNIISFLLTLFIVFIVPIRIAQAGFMYVVNSVNPKGIDDAKKILTNTIYGIIIALAAWMIVDAVMAVLYNPDNAGGTWSSLIYSSGDSCLSQAGALPGDALHPTTTTPGVTTGKGTGTSGTLGTPPAGKAGTACDPAVVMAAAAAGGYTLTATQANIFACIAQPESSCGAPQNPPNYNWNSAKSSPGSTAAGAFQVLLASNHSCYENAACYSAAGTTGPLNCQNGFDSNGNPKTDAAGAAIVTKCVQAASNLNCSASAAACLLQKNGGSFSAWQADVNSQKQTGCITSGA